MKVLDVIEQLEDSQIFKDWKKNNPSDYIVNVFKFVKVEDTPWQVGYYNKEKDVVTTFNVDNEISMNDPSEVFKKEEIIEKLDIDNVKIDYSEALNFATKFQKENFSNDMPTQIIVLLQNKNYDMYNITFITATLKTLNMKISALDGSVMESKLNSIMDFKQKE